MHQVPLLVLDIPYSACLHINIPLVFWYNSQKHEAQLSQRDRAMLRVIKYSLSHSRTLKVIRKDTAD